MDKSSERIVREMERQGQLSRFGINPIPRHIHSDINSPQTYQPVRTYIGIILTSSTPSTLPAGWSAKKIGTGVTEVTHNLGELDQIAWVATPIGAGGATIPVPIVVPGPNVVDFSWFDVSVIGGGAAVDTTFMFMATQVNNKKTTTPPYKVFS